MSDQAWISADGTLRPGIYYGMSDADYQAIDALRASTMKEALQSAKQLHYRMHNRRPDSGALRLGRAVHLAVLQPEEYEGETARIPDEYATASGLSRKKPAQEWAAPLMASGVTVVSAAEDAKAHAIASAVFEHAAAATMLQAAPGREVTAIWYETTPQGHKVACKARADFLGEGTLGDLKTTRETNRFHPAGVAAVIARFGYDYQFGWYERGLISASEQAGEAHTFDALRWAWIFVQSEAPHDVICAIADDEMQDLGRWRAQCVWETYASARDCGAWPGVAPDPVVVSLPRWAVPHTDEDDSDYLEGLA